jgi:hypothetical protein
MKTLKNKINIFLILILSIGILLFSLFLINNYSLNMKDLYVIKSTNLIEDPSFENFNDTAKDCCNNLPGEANISSKKNIHAIEGEYCLQLSSNNHCACINKPTINFNKESPSLLTFFYKGDNPRFCIWFEGDKRCSPNKELETTNEWTQQKEILIPTEKTEGISLYFYADSDGTKTVTNYYDDLQIKQLMAINNTYNFQDNENYIIKTKADNEVNGERISEIKNGEAYFLIQGEPNITIKFPLTELIIILIMLIIIIRLTKHEKH